MEVFVSKSAEETTQLGIEFGKKLKRNSVVCFLGDLGAGKTTFIKGLAAGVGYQNLKDVNSPTFVYLNLYKGKKTIYHFDLYRLRDLDEFLSMGFDEYFSAGGICCIEWAEKILPILPSEFIFVKIIHEKANTRKITIQ